MDVFIIKPSNNCIMINTTKSNWTIFGLSNFSYDILDAIKSNGEHIQCFVSNQRVDEDILVRIPNNIKVIELCDFKPTTDCYFLGFMDYHKDSLLRVLDGFNLTFGNIIHSRAYVSSYSQLGQGNFIGANSTIAPKVTIGDFNFINRNCSVGHHSTIGNRNKTGPGVTISSLCNIQNNNAFGSGSTVLPEIKICSGNIIGAGSVVTKDMKIPGTYVGLPAKKL